MGRKRANNRETLRQLVDPKRKDREGLMEELERMPEWSANELAAYSAAFYDMQAVMASDAELRNRAYVNARNQIKNKGGHKEQMASDPTKNQYIIDEDKGRGLVGFMSRTFNTSRAREYLDEVRKQVDEDEEAFAMAKSSPTEPVPITEGENYPVMSMEFAVIEYMLQVLIGKKRGGEYVDVRRLRKDLWRFMDIYNAVVEDRASEGAVEEAQLLHDRLTDCNEYVREKQDRKRNAKVPGEKAKLGVDWGDVFPWLPDMDG